MFSISQLIMIPAALLLLRFIFSLSLTGFPVKGVSWTNDPSKWHHTLARLQNEQLYNVASTRDKDYDDFNKTLDNILIMRVPGTDGHEKVRNYITSSMKALAWDVEEDSFEDRTPHGKKPFTNIVATLNPNACRRLTIACHYDSLNNREYTFLGATDSAVPCAMMINAARILHDPLKIQKEKGYDSINREEMLETMDEIGLSKKMINLVNKTLDLKKAKDNELTLQFVFFDGEEAFQRWSKTDSLYGSRHLAAKWNRMRPFPDPLYGSQCKGKDYASYLDRMDVMVLLDLIGTANPTFYSYFPDTYGLYYQIVDIEKRLNSAGLVEAQVPERNTRYFDSRSTLAFVEDDHIPFMKRGVPIVHLIPSPFPHVWHKENDNRDSLHHPTINNLNKILRVFIAEYLHLGVKSSEVFM